jgi:hypothetical protein
MAFSEEKECGLNVVVGVFSPYPAPRVGRTQSNGKIDWRVGSGFDGDRGGI